MEKYLTDTEAAEFLRRSVHTLRRWRIDNTGPRYIIDGHGGIRYLLEDLENWIIEGGEGGGNRRSA